MEEAVVKMVTNICKDENIVVDWTIQGVRKPSDYVESWRILLWDKAFIPFFGNKDQKLYTKKSIFKEFPGTESAVRRIVYRY
jgi:hypothetical protein